MDGGSVMNKMDKITIDKAVSRILEKYNQPPKYKHVKPVGKLNAAYAFGCDRQNGGGGS